MSLSDDERIMLVRLDEAVRGTGGVLDSLAELKDSIVQLANRTDELHESAYQAEALARGAREIAEDTRGYVRTRTGFTAVLAAALATVAGVVGWFRGNM